jgi:hypothetical protein
MDAHHAPGPMEGRGQVGDRQRRCGRGYDRVLGGELLQLFEDMALRGRLLDRRLQDEAAP